MEIYLFHRDARRINDALSSLGRMVNLFLMDSQVVSENYGFVVTKLMGLVVELRLNAETIVAVNKADLLENLKEKSDSEMGKGIMSELIMKNFEDS